MTKPLNMQPFPWPELFSKQETAEAMAAIQSAQASAAIRTAKKPAAPKPPEVIDVAAHFVENTTPSHQVVCIPTAITPTHNPILAAQMRKAYGAPSPKA